MYFCLILYVSYTNMFKITTLALVLLLCGVQIIAEEMIHEIFLQNACLLNCTYKGEEFTHTYCMDNDFKRRNCNVYAYNIKSLRKINVIGQLILGHNGMRDRIAKRMQVAAMNEIFWSKELEFMAKRYTYKCTPFENDPCTHSDTIFTDYNQDNDIETYDKENAPETTTRKSSFTGAVVKSAPFVFIRQNRYCQLTQFFPNNFIELALSTWYNERNDMEPPEFYTSSGPDIVKYRLKGSNNFTNLADPRIEKFGCSIANIAKKYFCIICNYCVVDQNNSELIYKHGTPVSHCPKTSPLRDSYYTNLCTTDPRFDKAQPQLKEFEQIFIIVVFLLHAIVN